MRPSLLPHRDTFAKGVIPGEASPGRAEGRESRTAGARRSRREDGFPSPHAAPKARREAGNDSAGLFAKVPAAGMESAFLRALALFHRQLALRFVDEEAWCRADAPVERAPGAGGAAGRRGAGRARASPLARFRARHAV